MPHRFASTADWEELARDLIIVCTGCTTATLPLPVMLDKTAPTAVGRQLQTQYRIGEWPISCTEVIHWLIDAVPTKQT